MPPSKSTPQNQNANANPPNPLLTLLLVLLVALIFISIAFLIVCPKEHTRRNSRGVTRCPTRNGLEDEEGEENGENGKEEYSGKVRSLVWDGGRYGGCGVGGRYGGVGSGKGGGYGVDGAVAGVEGGGRVRDGEGDGVSKRVKCDAFDESGDGIEGNYIAPRAELGGSRDEEYGIA